MNDANPPEHGRMRASDADRDSVAHRLREALAEGRLDPDEHSERLDSVYRAKTIGELVPLTEDLPATDQGSSLTPVSGDFRSPRPVYGSGRVTPQSAPTSTAAVAVMGGADRAGAWVVPKNFFALSLMGGVELDLREARFVHRETTIWTGAVMAGIEIRVPDDIQVRVHGLPIMGGFGNEGGTPPSVVDPDAPIVHVRGLAVMAGVGVVYKRRKHQRERDDED
ncbi:DUF1707 domain-containing protein [Nocardiopsis sp. CT-R113]|uniref:DUF1707 domain-containing protein n=1 Tax=Nocardiopsis codii TaxID=3065942 RepID=A0ABU7K7V4_9ACTN|nr:DUF1707 domain-containing protein [Nocardiopsis sp. CT-R113]MEE2038313.1 DUF1707 domain-containing protein [Nocardiopsis sp. CT-R113]